MSREDPQFRIRLPAELKEKIEGFAKDNGRSLNAEIVHRLASSFADEILEDELISAVDASLVARAAKEELSQTVFKRTLAEINKKIRIGHTSFSVDLSDFDLEALHEDEFLSVINPTIKKLTELGYDVPDSTLDVDGFLVVIP